MNKAFENILERFDEIKGCACDGRSCSECEYTYDCLEGEMSENVAIDKAKEIVQEVAEEYIQKFPLDTKRCIAEMYAHHMVNYGIDVTSKWETAVQQAYALEKAYIRGKQEERDRLYEHIKEHNNGWIPCSERLPDVEADVLLSLRNLDIYTGFRANTEGYFYVNGVGGKYVPFDNVVAWQPPTFSVPRGVLKYNKIPISL